MADEGGGGFFDIFRKHKAAKDLAAQAALTPKPQVSDPGAAGTPDATLQSDANAYSERKTPMMNRAQPTTTPQEAKQPESITPQQAPLETAA